MTNLEIKDFFIYCNRCSHKRSKITVYYSFEERKVKWKCEDCGHEELFDYNVKEVKQAPPKEVKKVSIRTLAQRSAKKYGVKKTEIEAYFQSLIKQSKI